VSSLEAYKAKQFHLMLSTVELGTHGTGQHLSTFTAAKQHQAVHIPGAPFSSGMASTSGIHQFNTSFLTHHSTTFLLTNAKIKKEVKFKKREKLIPHTRRNKHFAPNNRL